MDYKTFAIGLAREAGTIMRTNFALGMKKEWKEDHSPVTETDMAIDAIVRAAIAKEYPDHGLLCEEGDGVCTNPDSEYIWICDPLDGTHNFSHGLPTFTFMLALVQNGTTIVGLIYDPMLDRMWYAEKGKGAFLNDAPIYVSDAKEVKRTVIGMGKMTSVMNLNPVFEELKKNNVRLITGLSIGYMGALVASGEFAATIFGGKDPHDTTAIQILVEEAGGKATDLFGGNTRYDRDVAGQLATNGHLHEELLQIINSQK